MLFVCPLVDFKLNIPVTLLTFLCLDDILLVVGTSIVAQKIEVIVWSRAANRPAGTWQLRQDDDPEATGERGDTNNYDTNCWIQYKINKRLVIESES